MISFALLLAANMYDPRLIMAGDLASIAKFAADVRACGYVVTVREWREGDISPKPQWVTTVALVDKPITPDDPKLPCFLDAERAAFTASRRQATSPT